jgi:hypothetical protein
MALITDPIFYLVAIPAVLLSGISKGGFGSAVVFSQSADQFALVTAGTYRRVAWPVDAEPGES